jgi:hypothetical protein
MRAADFARRFRDHQEIGREVADTHVLVFYDDGKDVGLWREDRRTTYGTGYILAPQDAEMARFWYRNAVRRWVDGERVEKKNGESSPHLPPIDP